jgi:hypothetical protein
MIGLDQNNYAEVPISHASNLTIALAFFTQFTGNHRHTKATANKSYFLLPSRPLGRTAQVTSIGDIGPYRAPGRRVREVSYQLDNTTQRSRAGVAQGRENSTIYPVTTPKIPASYDMGVNSQHCSFVLLAEFDIDRGAKLTYQFPQPLGADEGCVIITDNATSESHLNFLTRLLANLMLPDGADKHLKDWIIFFLNQTPFNTIEPVLALETPDSPGKENKSDLLFVLNLVRTKHDKSVRR